MKFYFPKNVQTNISLRFKLALSFLTGFLIVSLLLRIAFMFWQFQEVSLTFFDLTRTICTGLFFDIGVSSFILFPGILYCVSLPNKFIGSIADKIAVYFFFSLTIFILVLVFFAEITFWEEFRTRFNFIAVDYLIYTHEVIGNIQESYPLPLLILGVAVITFFIIFLFQKFHVFKKTFSANLSKKDRVFAFSTCLFVLLFFSFFVKNTEAEWSANRYNSEISKAGIYSFFAEFRKNQMEYVAFYTSTNQKRAFEIVRKNSQESDSKFLKNDFSIRRNIDDIKTKYDTPNIVFILMESMSGSFMKEFGNTQNITPNMDSLAQQSIFFNNLFATGTRTVRGMEAVTLCIPPTPGQSIVKRPDNQNLFTIASVFKKKKYESNFFYGGDGYFDNMNSYFGGNGFTIYDRGRGSVLSDKIKTKRNNIDDEEVTFENAWGICDEDIYEKMLRVADEHYAEKKPFFNFVMTTSNHRPYTYPNNKIDILSGTGRNGAVKYADYALGKMLFEAKKKPWFKNTVFVIVADHCASSAGKDEIDIANYHIPAIIYNMPNQDNVKIDRQCSQIDLFPTLFSLLNWDYESNFFGKNVFDQSFKDRTFVGTYRKLAYLEKNKAMILSDQKKQAFYSWNNKTNALKPLKMDVKFLDEAISWYQTADYLFTNKLLKE